MKTKTTLLISFLFFLLISTFSSAQDVQLWSIDLNFCNNQAITSELDLTTKAGEQTPICINFVNTSPEDTTINIDFLDSTITQDWHKNRACNAADRPKKYFGNFMLDYEKTITLKWNSTIQKIFNIKPPIWYKWLSHGCIAYNLVQTGEKAGESMLNIVVRKIKFIDIFVWETQIKSQINIWSIKTIKTWKITNFQIWLRNIWNISQNATISWTISNIFWFKKILQINKNTIIIPPNEEMFIQTDNEDLIMPPYGWPFTVSFEIINKPSFDFNIKEDVPNNTIPKDVIAGWSFKISKTFFIFNPYFIWVLIILLILIYLAFFKKRKRIILNPQQINPPTSTPDNKQISNNEQSKASFGDTQSNASSI